jgi:DnaJ domain
MVLVHVSIGFLWTRVVGYSRFPQSDNDIRFGWIILPVNSCVFDRNSLVIMARKKSSPFDEVIGIVVLAGIALLFALPYLITVVYYLFPFALVWLSLNAPAAIAAPDVGDISSESAQETFNKSREEKDEAEREYVDLLASGRSEGVRYLHHEERFENRSNRGKELNERPYDIRERVHYLEQKLEVLDDPYARAFVTWRDKFIAWHECRAYKVAFESAIWTFLACVALLEIFAFSRGGFTSVPLVWNPLPAIFRQSTVVGALVGWVVALATLFVAKRLYRKQAETECERIAEDLDNSRQPEEDPALSGSYEGDEPSEEEWHEILQVSEDASDDDIKRAYKDAIKRCHPDMVANLSENIQEAALNDTVRVNSAYERARAARGF